MCLNLKSYVINPFTSEAKLDLIKLKDHAKKAQRLMDDMLDLELEKIQQIIDKVESDPEDLESKECELNLWKRIYSKTSEGRRTGLGVTAEGDMLAMMGLRYGSKKAIDLCDVVHSRITIGSYESSIDLAGERGAFPAYERNLDLLSPFIRRIFDNLSQEYREAWRSYGRRNIANLTLAPTGSVSICTQSTSGIEPAFMIFYKRRRKTTDITKAVFTDATGCMFEEYTVFHQGFIQWYQVTNQIDTYENAFLELNSMSQEDLDALYEKSPYYKSTSEDIDWVNKVKMQGVIQKWIDHSISCTVNMPNEVTRETVSKVYETAWRSGCKGATIYRAGSRDGILISAKKTNIEKKVTTRPETIEAKVVRFRNGNENWIAFVGVVDNRPFEVFSGKIGDDVKYLPKSIEVGKITKVRNEDGTHRYDFSYEVGFGYINTLPDIGTAFNPECYNYARFVSALLQEGTKPERIINVLNKLKCGDTINTWNRGVARALKTFVSDGAKSGQTCPYCGAELVYYNGCTTCHGCGKGGKCD